MSLIPVSSLESGEYALVSVNSDTKELQATAWDFKVQ